MAGEEDAARAVSEVGLRPAAEGDFAQISEIYGHAVLHGLASFEEVAPDETEMRRRWAALVEKGYRYFVAESAGEILGYAYAGPYRPRPAYRFTVETSVYVAPGAGRRNGPVLPGTSLLNRDDCRMPGLHKQRNTGTR